MATQDDVRRIASLLPGAVEGQERFGFSVEVKGKWKGFCWSWAERVDPKKARVINDEVLVISVPGLAAKELLVGSAQDRFVDDPHYNGYPAVIVRLADWSAEELEDLLTEAWKSKASKELLRQFDAG
ncbi:MAG: hypothetical protein H7Y17_09000 [Chlorobia bacterium]|nr:hypothetical protein [Fimbriimonadaceae bacterium]